MPTVTRRQAKVLAGTETQTSAAAEAAPSSPHLPTNRSSPARSENATPAETGAPGSSGRMSSRSSSPSKRSSSSLSDEDVLGSDEWPRSPTPQRPSRRELQWSEEKNLALAKALLKHRPFEAEYGSVTAAWNRVKNELDAAGYAFKAFKTIQKHAEELIKQQRHDDAAAAKKSGANEDVTELTKVMAQVVSLIDDAKLKKTATTAHGRAKARFERDAGAQLRDAAMRGMVDRDTLLDVASLDDATTREKSGQRAKRPRSPSPPDANKENEGPSKPQSKRRRRVHDEASPDDTFIKVLEKMNAADEELLRKALAAQEAASRKQDELIDKLGQLIQVTAAGLQQQDHAAEERRREERREERREQQEDFMRMLAAFSQFNKPNQN